MHTFTLQIASLGVTWFKKDDDQSRGVQKRIRRMIRDLKNLPKITGKEKQIEKTGQEGIITGDSDFFLFKSFCRGKGTAVLNE